MSIQNAFEIARGEAVVFEIFYKNSIGLIFVDFVQKNLDIEKRISAHVFRNYQSPNRYPATETRDFLPGKFTNLEDFFSEGSSNYANRQKTSIDTNFEQNSIKLTIKYADAVIIKRKDSVKLDKPVLIEVESKIFLLQPNTNNSLLFNSFEEKFDEDSVNLLPTPSIHVNYVYALNSMIGYKMGGIYYIFKEIRYAEANANVFLENSNSFNCIRVKIESSECNFRLKTVLNENDLNSEECDGNEICPSDIVRMKKLDQFDEFYSLKIKDESAIVVVRNKKIYFNLDTSWTLDKNWFQKNENMKFKILADNNSATIRALYMKYDAAQFLDIFSNFEIKDMALVQCKNNRAVSLNVFDSNNLSSSRDTTAALQFVFKESEIESQIRADYTYSGPAECIKSNEKDFTVKKFGIFGKGCTLRETIEFYLTLMIKKKNALYVFSGDKKSKCNKPTDLDFMQGNLFVFNKNHIISIRDNGTIEFVKTPDATMDTKFQSQMRVILIKSNTILIVLKNNGLIAAVINKRLLHIKMYLSLFEAVETGNYKPFEICIEKKQYQYFVTESGNPVSSGHLKISKDGDLEEDCEPPSEISDKSECRFQEGKSSFLSIRKNQIEFNHARTTLSRIFVSEAGNLCFHGNEGQMSSDSDKIIYTLQNRAYTFQHAGHVDPKLHVNDVKIRVSQKIHFLKEFSALIIQHENAILVILVLNRPSAMTKFKLPVLSFTYNKLGSLEAKDVPKEGTSICSSLIETIDFTPLMLNQQGDCFVNLNKNPRKLWITAIQNQFTINSRPDFFFKSKKYEVTEMSDSFFLRLASDGLAFFCLADYCAGGTIKILKSSKKQITNLENRQIGSSNVEFITEETNSHGEGDINETPKFENFVGIKRDRIIQLNSKVYRKNVEKAFESNIGGYKCFKEKYFKANVIYKKTSLIEYFLRTPTGFRSACCDTVLKSHCREFTIKLGLFALRLDIKSKAKAGSKKMDFFKAFEANDGSVCFVSPTENPEMPHGAIKATEIEITLIMSGVDEVSYKKRDFGTEKAVMDVCSPNYISNMPVVIDFEGAVRNAPNYFLWVVYGLLTAVAILSTTLLVLYFSRKYLRRRRVLTLTPAIRRKLRAGL